MAAILVFSSAHLSEIPLSRPSIKSAPNLVKSAITSMNDLPRPPSHSPKRLPALVAPSSSCWVVLMGVSRLVTHSHAEPRALLIPSHIGLSGLRAPAIASNAGVNTAATGPSPSLSPWKKPEKKAFIGSQ